MSLQPLSDGEVDQALDTLPGWTRQNDALHLEVRLADFRQAMQFLIGVGFRAEARGHHPEIFNVYNRVNLRLTTHDAGDRITEKDIQLAGDILELLPGPSTSDN